MQSTSNYQQIIIGFGLNQTYYSIKIGFWSYVKHIIITENKHKICFFLLIFWKFMDISKSKTQNV